jgi:hypothetical protein
VSATASCQPRRRSLTRIANRPRPSGSTASGSANRRLNAARAPIRRSPSRSRRIARNLIPGVWPASAQKEATIQALMERITRTATRTPTVPRPPSSEPKMKLRIAASRPAASEKPTNSRPMSIAAARARVTRPAALVTPSRFGRRSSARTIRSSTLSSGRVSRRTWRPMSPIRPTPCWAIAARTSGASATRSTSICALSEARIRSQTRSAASLSIASSTRPSRSAWAAVRVRTSSRRPSSASLISARSSAGLSTARTIDSSAAASSA